MISLLQRQGRVRRGGIVFMADPPDAPSNENVKAARRKSAIESAESVDCGAHMLLRGKRTG